jgi:hypothetical protein
LERWAKRQIQKRYALAPVCPPVDDLKEQETVVEESAGKEEPAEESQTETAEDNMPETAADETPVKDEELTLEEKSK